MATKSGGPKTPVGKAKSAINATKHGLTSMQAVGEDERALIESFRDELTAYYCPDSPLERLQIERIAICRAKLSRLYEVERVRLSLVTEELSANPQQILDMMGEVEGVTRSLVLQLISKGTLSLPHQITYEQLQTIAHEITLFDGRLVKEEDINQASPTLFQFLTTLPVAGSEESLVSRFKDFIFRINFLLSSGGYTAEFDQALNQMQAEKILQNEKSPEELAKQEAFDRELEEYSRRLHPKLYSSDRLARKEKERATITPLDHDDLMGKFGLLSQLVQHVDQAQIVFERYQRLRDLYIRSASLPSAESDLLMRYQTTLERRLSSAIGELLSLQSKRVPALRMDENGSSV